LPEFRVFWNRKVLPTRNLSWNWKRAAGYCCWAVLSWVAPVVGVWWANWRGSQRVWRWSGK
ncbi:MAG: hypothetical protein ACE1Y4_06865, partial [Lysobacterales bacterium]